jgi:UDP-2,3-diacylglucosamine pyrophosphatase LpxH
MSLKKAIKEAEQKKSLAEEIKAKDKLITQLEKQLDDSRRASYAIKKTKPRKRKRGDFIRVVVPDTHGCFMDQDAAAAMFADIERLNPQEIVMLGDHLECGNMLAQHHTASYVAQVESKGYTFEKDIAAANTLLDKLQELSPGAAIHYLEGNHEQRIEKYCVTAAKRSGAENQGKEADHLMKLYGTEHVLYLEKRGIHYYKQGKFYMGLGLPSTIKLGECAFVHGISTAQSAAAVHLSRFGCCVVFGHTHRMDSHHVKTISAGNIGAWSPGCLCKLQPLWCHQRPTNWAHGYGVQLVSQSGTFLHINVPIHKGTSYLTLLTDRLGE